MTAAIPIGLEHVGRLNRSLESVLSLLRDLVHEISENLISNRTELALYINEIFDLKLILK